MKGLTLFVFFIEMTYAFLLFSFLSYKSVLREKSNYLTNSPVLQLIRLSKDTGGKVEIEQAEINRKVKAITAYYGELACDASW